VEGKAGDLHVKNCTAENGVKKDRGPNGWKGKETGDARRCCLEQQGNS